jgi:hypothetical protein
MHWRRNQLAVPTISSFEVFKRLMVLVGLLGFAILSFVAKVWLGVILFGGFSLVAAWEILRLRKRRMIRAPLGQSFKASFHWIGSIAIALLFGLGGELIANSLSGLRLGVAIWVGAFVSTLAFYPFRGDQKHDFPTFPLWMIYCALNSLFSVGISFVPGLLA